MQPTDTSATQYLPEPIYFRDADFSVLGAAVATAKCVAKWATRYRAWPIGHAGRVYEGIVEGPVFRRHELVEQLFRDIAASAPHPALLGLLLLDGANVLLDQHDGIPAKLNLETDRFVDVQQCLADFGYPTDLYFQKSELREGQAVVQYLGGKILSRRLFSPKEWELRHQLQAEVRPPESERLERFVESCRDFRRELRLRIAELSEPDSTKPLAAAEDLERLYEHVLLLELQAQGRDTTAWEQALDRARAQEELGRQ